MIYHIKKFLSYMQEYYVTQL